MKCLWCKIETISNGHLCRGCFAVIQQKAETAKKRISLDEHINKLEADRIDAEYAEVFGVHHPVVWFMLHGKEEANENC